jgi:hypothetical protein
MLVEKYVNHQPLNRQSEQWILPEVVVGRSNLRPAK